MQRLGGLNLHGAAGGIAYAHDNHQRHQQPREHQGEHEARRVEGQSADVHQFGHANVQGNNRGGHGGQREQQQAFGYQSHEDAPPRAAHRHAERHLLTAVLRAEPEGADHAQEDVQQQEAQDAELRLDFVDVFQLLDVLKLVEREDVEHVDVAHAVEAVGLGHERLGEAMVGLGRDAHAQLQVGGVLVLHHHLAREVRRQEGPAPLVGGREVVPAHGLGNARHTQAVISVRLPQGQPAAQQLRGVGPAQGVAVRRRVAREDHRARPQHGGQRVGARGVHRPPVGALHGHAADAEQAHVVGLRQAKHGVDGHRVHEGLNAVAAVAVGDAVLRDGHRLHAGTVAQALGYLQQVVHVVAHGAAGRVEGGVRRQAVHHQAVAVTRVEAHRGEVDARRHAAPVHDVPQHHEDHQQFQREEKVAAPFVSQLSKEFFHHSIFRSPPSRCGEGEN